MKISEAQVEEHVGRRAMRRVRWYEVDEPILRGHTIQGRVAGFAVSAVLEHPLTSRCSCLYRTACDHAAVLLIGWVRTPERFRRERFEPVELPEDPGDLVEWFEENDPAFLGSTLDELLERGHYLPRSHPLWRWMDGDLGSALRQIADDTQSGRVDPVKALAPILSELTDRVTQRRDARRALEAARKWRENPPDDALLKPLFDAVHDAIREQDLERPPGSLGSVSLRDDELQFRLRTAPQRPVVVSVTQGFLARVPAFQRPDVAAVTLDHVIGPLSPDVRQGVVTLLGTPTWEKAMRRLDQALALDAGAEEGDLGWQLKTSEGRIDRVGLVRLTPYKTRAGYRTRKVKSVSLFELTRPADRAAHSALKASASVPIVLEQLIDHPQVVDEDGGLVRVRRSVLSLAVREREQLHVEALLDGDALPEDRVAALEATGGLAAVRTGSSVHVVSVSPVVEGVIDMLVRYGFAYPRAARGALMRRLGMLEEAVPLRLHGPMRGRESAGDLRPVLRLVPLADGALRVEVRVRPLPEGPAVRPGAGTEELAVIQGGERVFVVRSLPVEGDVVRDRLRSLQLPSLQDWDGVVEHPDLALDLVRSLHDREDVVVEWPGRALRVLRTEATVPSLRVAANERRDWFGLGGQVQVGRRAIPLAQLLEAIRNRRRYVEIDNRGWVRLTDALIRSLRDAALLSSDGEPKLSPLAAARAALALQRAGAEVDAPESLRDLEARIRASEQVERQDHAPVAATLRGYQVDGVTWLRRMAMWAPGAILADDMGLGKTLQSIALLVERSDKPQLVVAPASVNLNWMREIQRFAPDLVVQLYRGPHREAMLQSPRGVLITSYALMLGDIDKLAEIPFSTVVFDEAQALKNALSKRARAARSLQADFNLALSGTPVENNLLELWSLMQVIAPGFLGTRDEYLDRFGRTDDGDREKLRGQLGSAVRPFILRRTKSEVAPDLPERVESIEWVELEGPDRIAYERVRRAALGALEGEGGGRMQVLAALTRLRQAACSGRLIDDEAPIGPKIQRLVRKVEAVRESGEQVLVFSQFTGLLDLAAQALEAEGVRLLRLDGRTPVAVRQERVDRFQAGEADVFLISLKAGGTGLNLTAASTVIHLDPWWNPAAEDQASDRAHRIGQTRRVQVIRFVAAGTVEEQVLSLHEEKRDLARSVLDGTAKTHTMGAGDLLRILERG